LARNTAYDNPAFLPSHSHFDSFPARRSQAGRVFYSERLGIHKTFSAVLATFLRNWDKLNWRMMIVYEPDWLTEGCLETASLRQKQDLASHRKACGWRACTKA